VLSQDFKEFIESLNARDVRYLIIGGYALAFHGHPRYTKDLDVWIETTDENAGRLIQALKDFGFGSLELTEKDFTVEGPIFQFGYPPNRIDILTKADGVDFQSCYQTRVTADVAGTRIAVIDVEGLKKNKASTGRKQDLADLELLEDADKD
jgi:hypothetical protein